MLKKVLCVVLSLVLALGAVSVAAFAATADELAEAVAKLPNEYNARFYNDETTAAIEAARAAAAAATTQDEIDAAYALCEEAYALATETAIDDFDAEYFSNRDESKGVVNYNISTDTTKLQPGDTFSVTLSIKTNFYFGNASVALCYDKEVFEFQGTENHVSELKYYDPNTNTLDRTDYYDGWVPMEWYYEDANGVSAFEKYAIATCVVNNNVATAVKDETLTFYPETETDLLTFNFKVADDAEDGTAKLFVDDTIGFHYFEYETDYDFYQQILGFTRGWDRILMPSTSSTNLSGNTLISGAEPIDVQAQFDQTIVFGGENATTYTSTTYGTQTVAVNGAAINMEIATSTPADYTGLDAALAEAAKYDAADWTEATYSVLKDAVAAGKACARDLTDESQATIDALEADIYDAIAGLKRQTAADCPITVVANVGETRYAKVSSFNVTVSGNPTKLRFVDTDGNSFTYTRDHANVTAITTNDDGTETWNINFTPYKTVEDYEVYVKYAETGWYASPYYYEMIASNTDVEDNRFVSYDVADDYEGVIYAGTYDVTIVTGLDVNKVQLVNGKNTWTFNADNASYVDANGVRTWTVSMNFAQYGEQSYAIRTRTFKTAFADTGASIDLLVYAE